MVKDLIKKIPGMYYLYNFYIKHFKYNNFLLLFQTYSYHIIRNIKYSGVSNSKTNGLITDIILLYHSIEKGLTMPNFRFGFGQEKLYKLTELIEEYIKQARDTEDSQFCTAVSILAEYLDIHKNYSLNEKLKNKMEEIVQRFPNVCKNNTLQLSREEFFSYNNAPFGLFSASRHSVRNFEGKIDIKQIVEAVELAKNAPSACNRQPTRIHLITEKKMITDCLSLQNGNKGFGHLVDKLIIVTGDLSTTTGYQEFADLYTNVGMFILNWHVVPTNDLKLRKIVNIPVNESVAAIIACGGIPDKFSLVSSPRRSTYELLTIH